MKTPVTAIFDIGKTNKKFFLFDDAFEEVHRQYRQFDLIEDEDGYPCEDLQSVTDWMRQTFENVVKSNEYQVQALNFSGYGASIVNVDEEGKPATPLYNYIKPFPQEILDAYYDQYGGKEQNNLETASPSLGMLNSGLQLYWLKKQRPHLFQKIKTSLHFPQYLSYVFSGKMVSEPTSIGCHTKLWDFECNQYHSWTAKEGIDKLFPETVPATTSFEVAFNSRPVRVGVGIHDSSSALVPYLKELKEPFILISTGTWSITVNPFSEEPLTLEQLRKDCLKFLGVHGKPVKAARLFLGNEMVHQIRKLDGIFHKNSGYYKNVPLNPDFLKQVEHGNIDYLFYPETIKNPLVEEVLSTEQWDPGIFGTYEEAYHHLMWGLVVLQKASLELVIGKTPVKHIIIDGGFVNNALFVQMLQHELPGYKLSVSSQPLGSALGAAMVVNEGVGDGIVG